MRAPWTSRGKSRRLTLRRRAAGHRARALPRAVEMGVDIVSDPHAEDDDGTTGPCSAVLGT